MTLFNSILNALKEKIDTQTAYKKVVITAIAAVTHHHLDPDEIISLKEGVLTIHTSPTLKSVLLLKKDRIISALHDAGLPVQRII